MAVSTWLLSLLYNNRPSHDDQALSYKSSFTKSTKLAYIYKYIQKSHFKNVQNIPFCTNVEKYPVWLFQARFQLWFMTLDTAVRSCSWFLLSEQREDTPPHCPSGGPDPSHPGPVTKVAGPIPTLPSLSASRRSLPHPSPYWCPEKKDEETQGEIGPQEDPGLTRMQ